MACLKDTRGLYNEMLAATKQHYAQTGKFLFKYDLTMLFKGRGGDTVPATTVQTLADRLDKALESRISPLKSRGCPAGFRASRPPIAGTAFSCVSMRRAVMCGWMLTRSTCMCLASWACC
jgi:hypothetical protein